ncbi:hypothetical protein [Xanthomonas phage SB4]|uniref:Uncharacterized protein n=1 Tax=Xanthomonas phage SB4 TaxID=3117473 RepID=A0ABZ2GYG1_9CAUD
MAKEVNNYIRITLPRSMMNHLGVQDAVKELTAYVGGVSRTESVGEWFDGEGARWFDVNYIMQWNFGAPQFPRADMLARRVVDALHKAGEQAVFRERDFNVNGKSKGYRARIIYPTKN